MKSFLISLVLLLVASTPAYAATWAEATAQVQSQYGWSTQKTNYSEDWYGNTQSDDNADQYLAVFTDPSTAPTWVGAFENALPAMIADSLHQSEQAYNTLIKTPFVPGQQYVQDNGDGSFTTVVTFSTLQAAESGYNAITYGGIPFVAGARYVQDDLDGTYKTVVRFPLDY